MYTKEQLEILNYDGLVKVKREMSKAIEDARNTGDWSTFAVAKYTRSLCYAYMELRKAEDTIVHTTRSIATMDIPKPFPPGMNSDLITVLDKYDVFLSTDGGWCIHLAGYDLDVSTHDESKDGLMRSVAFPGLDEDIVVLNEKYGLYDASETR